MQDWLMKLWHSHIMVYMYNLYYVLLYVEKSHDLPSARWWPRKSGGVIPVQIHRLEIYASQ